MAIRDWRSDVCSSDLPDTLPRLPSTVRPGKACVMTDGLPLPLILAAALLASASPGPATLAIAGTSMKSGRKYGLTVAAGILTGSLVWSTAAAFGLGAALLANAWVRSEEHTSELQSLMRISYAVFCLKKKKQLNQSQTRI